MAKRGSFGRGSGGFQFSTPGSRSPGQFSASSASSTATGPLQIGGKLAAAQAGTLYSQQQAWTAAGYGPTGDYTSKPQSWVQRAAARKRRSHRFNQESQDQDGFTSSMGYYNRSRVKRGLDSIPDNAATAKDVVSWLQRRNDRDAKSSRGRTFVVIFEKGAQEASAAGDQKMAEMLLDAAAKARRSDRQSARRMGGRARDEWQRPQRRRFRVAGSSPRSLYADQYEEELYDDGNEYLTESMGENLDGIIDEAKNLGEDVYARAMAAPTWAKVAYGVVVLAVLKKKKII